MSLDIDITDKTANEIIEILDNYPRGRLEIKYERVFWVSDFSTPVSRQNPESPPRGRTSNPRGNMSRTAQGFQNAADTLGSMMGPPRQ